MAFQFIQMTDSHLYGNAADSELDARDIYYRRCLREVARHAPDFIVHTGDLVNGCSGFPRHVRFKALLDEMSGELAIPIRVCRGNHESARAHITDAQFADVWGSLNYRFEHKGWTFLAIDSYVGSYPHSGFFYAMSPEVLDWLHGTLSRIPKTVPLVVMMHVAPIGITNFWRGESVLHALREHNVQALLFGHVQANWAAMYDGIPHYTVVGERAPFDASPLTYNRITCGDDGALVCDFFPYKTHVPPAAAISPPGNGGRARPTDDWLDLRGPLGTRCAARDIPSTAPRLAWKQVLPGPLSIGAPTLKDGVIYAGTKTNGRFDQCAVCALDAASGASRWTRATDGSVEGGLFVHGNRGYCGTSSGSVYCLELETGEIVWQWNNRDNIPISSQPIFDDGLVHVGANLQIYAIDADAGRTTWRTTVNDKSSGYFAGGHSSPVVVDKRVFHQRACGSVDPALLVSLDKHTGTGKEFTPAIYSDQAMKRHASPLFHKGHIIAVARGLLAFDRQNLQKPTAHCVHAQSGATPAVRGAMAYVSYHTHIAAHDIRDGGRIVWVQPHEPALYHFGGEWNYAPSYTGDTLPSGNYSAPLAGGENLLVCATSGVCRCLHAATGKEEWRLRVPAPILSAPVLSGNTLYFGDYDGTLYAFAW